MDQSTMFTKEQMSGSGQLNMLDQIDRAMEQEETSNPEENENTDTKTKTNATL